MCFKKYFLLLIIFVFSVCYISCNKAKQSNFTDSKVEEETPDGMIWVAGKSFVMGAKEGDAFAMMREKPAHRVFVDGFFMDAHEVTNKQFSTFVAATNYITTAEKPINWNEIKKDLPENTPRPPDAVLRSGSLIFNKNAGLVVSMNNYQQWWVWKVGADWKHPAGPTSSITGKENYPVVHVSYQDAKAYCSWANRRLPTEAEWEAAAQGAGTNNIFTWGNNSKALDKNANTWQGVFPTSNTAKDGYLYNAPVKSYPKTTTGFYDLTGNVWEMTADLFDINYYRNLNVKEVLKNPKGAKNSFVSETATQQEFVIKGGSFLCHVSYCASFRISARMGMEPNSSSDHIGFRTIATKKMLLK